MPQSIKEQMKNMLVTSRGGAKKSLRFDDNTSKKYGVDFLQRVNTPRGLGTVIGEGDANLWVWLDEDEQKGVSYWPDFSINNLGFSLSDDKNYPSSLVSYFTQLFNVSFAKLPLSEDTQDTLAVEVAEIKQLLSQGGIDTPSHVDALLQHVEKKSIIDVLKFMMLSPHSARSLTNSELFNLIITHPSIKDMVETFGFLKKINQYNDENIISLLTTGKLVPVYQKKLEQYLLVQSHIQKNGALYGNKSANLIELNQLFKHHSGQLFQVQVPEIFPIEDAMVKAHLDKFAPDWRKRWDEFVQAQQGRKTLQDDALTILKALHTLITKTFKDHCFDSPIIQSIHLPSDTLFMVRSTGDEDKVDLANPGGNKSVPAVKLDANAFSTAMGTVIASYFSEKSLSQRLLSNDNITKPPFMPVLIQKMIGEKLNGNAPHEIVISGVMYAKENMTRIEVAPGQGELIVNSKGHFDTYDLTSEQVVHAAIYHKKNRLVPTEQADGKRKLIFKENSKALQEGPSISQAIAKEIGNVGEMVAKHYGIPVDVEIVYEPRKKILYLVQARPIQQIARFNTQPSAISPEHWFQIKQHHDIEKSKVKVVSPAGDAAQVITNKDQILFQKTIAQALKFYLDHPEIQDRIRTVVVKDDAPSTSHEAAQFNAMSVVVVQADKKILNRWLKIDNSVLIVDPQRQHIINWTTQIQDNQQPEKELRDNKIIVPGLFSSSLSPQKTLLPIDYQYTKSVEETLKKYLLASWQTIDTKHVYSDLNACFEVIESAKPQSENQAAFAALQKIAAIFKAIGTSSNAKEKDSPHQKIFLHALFSLAEIDQCLKNYSSVGLQEKTSVASEQRHLLDLVSKLKALTINPGEKELYSDSLMQIAMQNKALSMINDNQAMNKSQQEFLLEFLKLGYLALRQDTADKWKKFAYFCSEGPGHRQMLASILKQMSSYHLESDLINGMFLHHLKGVSKATDDQYNKVLVTLFEEVVKSKEEFKKLNFNEHNDLIAIWEKRIEEWSVPQKFEHLFKDFNADIIPLITAISIDDSMTDLSKKAILKQVQRLTELIDKTIKSMKGSPEYNKDQEAVLIQQFIKLLTPYHDLMQKWMNNIPENQYDKWARKIRTDFRYNFKDSMIEVIESSFKDKIKLINNYQAELHPSGCISVASAKVGSAASFSRQMVEKKDSMTLEDYFSLFHQNILSSLVILGKELELPIENLPEKLQPLLQALANNDSIDFLGHHHEPPVIMLEYNIPLDNHSGKLTIEYNTDTENVLLRGNFFGRNWEDRMNFIGRMAEMEGLLLNSQLVSKPNYSEKNLSMEFAWQFKDTEIDLLVKNINEIIQHYANMTEIQNSKPDTQKILDRNLKFKTVDELFKSLSTKNAKLFKEKINILTDVTELILDFPSLIDFLDKDAHDFRLAIYQNVRWISFEKLMHVLDKVKIDVNYKGNGVDSLFERMSDHFSDPELLEFINKFHPDLSQQNFSIYTSNLELINSMLGHGMPIINFKFSADDLVSYLKDNQFKSCLIKSIGVHDDEKICNWFIALFNYVSQEKIRDPLLFLLKTLMSNIDWNRPLPDHTFFEKLLESSRFRSPELLNDICENMKIDFAKQTKVFSTILSYGDSKAAEWLLEKGVPINLDELNYHEGCMSDRGREILLRCFDRFSQEEIREAIYQTIMPSMNASMKLPSFLDLFVKTADFSDVFYKKVLQHFQHLIDFNFKEANKEYSLFENLLQQKHNHTELLKSIIDGDQFDCKKHPHAISLACAESKFEIAMLIAKRKAKELSLSSEDIKLIYSQFPSKNSPELKAWLHETYSLMNQGIKSNIEVLNKLPINKNDLQLKLLEINGEQEKLQALASPKPLSDPKFNHTFSFFSAPKRQKLNEGDGSFRPILSTFLP